MKLITALVINMDTLETVYEDSYEYEGDVALCGGTGPSGSIDFPDYMEKIHVNWLTGGTKDSPAPALTTSMEDVLENALTTDNPYTNTSAHNPSVALSAMQTQYDTTKTVITGLDEEADWASMVTKALTKIDDFLLSDSDIDTLVDEYETSNEGRFNRGVAEFAGTISDINAVHASTFVMGLGLLVRDRNKDSDSFRANLKLKQQDSRAQILTQSVAHMIHILEMRVRSTMAMIQIQADISRMSIVANKEQRDRDLEIDVLDALWDFEVFQYAGNLLASISGSGHPSANKPSKLQSALGGGLSGAAIGMQLGGPVGAGIGFGVGALAGAFF